MAVTQEGSVLTVNADGGASGSADVTLSALTEGLIIFWHAWHGSGLDMTSLSVEGDAMTLAENHARSGDANAVGVAWRAAPQTGANITIAWVWNGAAPAEGGRLYLVQVKGNDTSAGAGAIQSSDSNAETGDTDPGPITCSDTDADNFVIGSLDAYDNGTTPNANIAGQTLVLDDDLYNDQYVDIATVDSPGATSTQFAGDGNTNNIYYSSIVAIAIKAAAAPGGGNPWYYYANQA